MKFNRYMNKLGGSISAPFFLHCTQEDGCVQERKKATEVQPIGHRHQKPLSGDENAEEKHEIVAIDVRFLHTRVHATHTASSRLRERALGAKHIKRSHT
jgi:hypothetical protein